MALRLPNTQERESEIARIQGLIDELEAKPRCQCYKGLLPNGRKAPKCLCNQRARDHRVAIYKQRLESLKTGQFRWDI